MRLISIITLCSLLACSTPVENASDPLQGTYKLIEWQGIREDGNVAYPYGESAEGIIQYDGHGNMSMQLQSGSRAPLGTDVYDSLDSEIVLEAFKSFFSYYGTYVFDEEDSIVTHVIAGCKNPDWVGRSLKRRYQLSPDELIIRSDSVIGMDHILRWKRISDKRP